MSTDVSLLIVKAITSMYSIALWILIEQRGTMWKAIKVFTLLISCFNSVFYSGAIASFHFLKIKVKTLPWPKSCVSLDLSLALAPSLLGELSSQEDKKSLRSQSLLRTVLRIDPASGDIKQPLSVCGSTSARQVQGPGAVIPSPSSGTRGTWIHHGSALLLRWS